jgi:hypothetical protein
METDGVAGVNSDDYRQEHSQLQRLQVELNSLILLLP